MNENWERWIKSSLYKHFREGLTPSYIWFQGEERRVDEPANRYEFNALGPDFDFITADQLTVEIVLNIQVVTNKDPKEPFRHLNNVGKLQTLFHRCLKMYKLGNFADVDTKAQFGQLDLESKVRTTDFGLLDPTAKILRTTVEATYKGDF